MLNITATSAWKSAFPGGMIGLLEVSGLDNGHPCPALDQSKIDIVDRIRTANAGKSRKDLLELPILAAYDRYYKHFDKTYHVLLQLESVAFKGKTLPTVSPVVDAYFAAELESLVLTAGHDVEKLTGPVVMDVSTDTDELTQMNGQPRLIRAGDMVMRDQHGLCCSILYGQDNRSPISPSTMHALFVSYAPAGVPVESVTDNFRLIEQYLRLSSPQAVVIQNQIISA